MRIQQQPAFVIHHHDYSETSLLLELFTRDFGRVGVIAKGARRPKNGRRALLNPFTPLRVGWSGKGELGVLTDVEADGAPFTLAGEVLYCGFYLNELLLRLLHRDDPHTVLFEAYHRSLGRLQQGGRIDVTLRMFEHQLLQEIGYGLVLDHDSNDNTAIAEDTLYEYVPESGPRRIGNADENVTGVVVHGSSLMALASGSIDEPRTLRELKRLMRFVLNRHLGGRQLNSRRLMRSVSRRTNITEGDSGR